jgi:hypothetical protein
MERIQEQVIKLRKLQPTGTVTRTLLTPDELRQHVINNFLDDYTPEDAQEDAIVLAAFGLLEPSFDLRSFYIELYSEQIAGFYDHEDKRMYLVQGESFSGPERMTYAHEYVHVLQDQNYDIQNGLNYSDDACKQDTERCAAIQALLEGDASMTEMQWFLSYASDQERQEIIDFYSDYTSPVYSSAPDFMRADFLFPYDAGQSFVEYLYDHGGWEAVDQAYRNPPVSTEQILHPERYPEDRPVQVTLPDFANSLGEGWKEIDRGVLGEWYTYLVLARGRDPSTQINDERARLAADGWQGDAYVVYYNEASQETILVLQMEWNDRGEANQFASAFIDYAKKRFGPPSQRNIWSTLGIYTTFYVNEAITTWILAPNPEIEAQISLLLNLP